MKKIVPVLVVGLLILLAIKGLVATDDPSPARPAGPSLPMTAELESDELQDTPLLERTTLASTDARAGAVPNSTLIARAVDPRRCVLRRSRR